MSTIPQQRICVALYAVSTLVVGVRQSGRGFPAASRQSGNISRNVRNGNVFACAPVSTLSVNRCLPGRLSKPICRVTNASFLCDVS